MQSGSSTAVPVPHLLESLRRFSAGIYVRSSTCRPRSPHSPPPYLLALSVCVSNVNHLPATVLLRFCPLFSVLPPLLFLSSSLSLLFLLLSLALRLSFLSTRRGDFISCSSSLAESDREQAGDSKVYICTYIRRSGRSQIVWDVRPEKSMEKFRKFRFDRLSKS